MKFKSSNVFNMVRYSLLNFFNFSAVASILTKSLVSIAPIVLTFLTSVSYVSFLTTSLSTTTFSSLKSVGTLRSLFASSLSTSDFVLAKSANSDVAPNATYFSSDFVALLDISHSTFILFLL